MVESDNPYVISNLVTTCGHVTSVQVLYIIMMIQLLYCDLLYKFKELLSQQLLNFGYYKHNYSAMNMIFCLRWGNVVTKYKLFSVTTQSYGLYSCYLAITYSYVLCMAGFHIC